MIVATAIATSSPELDDVLRSLGARKIDVLMKVSIPQALPQFFGSIKLAIAGAFIGTIVAETSRHSGIGYVMVMATNNMDGPLAYAGLAVLADHGDRALPHRCVRRKASDRLGVSPRLDRKGNRR